MNDVHKWEPIQDLPPNWQEFSDDDLTSLASSWLDRSKQLRESSMVRDFLERLTRKWAIETGIIERIYTLDRGVTEVLIERGIELSLIPHGASDQPPELVISLIKDQKEVIDGLFDFVSQRRNLSISYIRELHQVFTRHQPTTMGRDRQNRLVEINIIRGDWKKWPNNPTRPDGQLHEYCPPEQVASEMDRLIALHDEHTKIGISPEVEAAWLHHRFAQIHPFQDGNGRVARALASLVFIRANWFPLAITDAIREDYILALEEADHGNLKKLIILFSRLEKTAFRNALSISEQIKPNDTVQSLIASSVERLRQKEDIERTRLFETSKELEESAYEMLRSIAGKLTVDLQNIKREYWSSIARSEKESEFWFKTQIIEIAKNIGYYANTRDYRAWLQMKIREDRMTNLVLSFHGLGYEYSGILAVSAFMEFRDETEEGNGAILEGPYQVCEDIFQFTSSDSLDTLKKRFGSWLEDVMIIGLEQWRRQL